MLKMQKAPRILTLSIWNVPIEDNSGIIWRQFRVHNPIVYTLNTVQNDVNDNDQFTRKTTIPQDNFLDLVNLISTITWYTFNF